MGTHTTNLNMYKTNMLTDGNDTFDFQRDINDNLDIIDTAVGKLSNLTTTQKGSLVGAINEIDSDLDGKASKDLDNLSATGQAIIDGKVSSADLYDANQLIKLNKLQTYSLPSNTYVDLTLGNGITGEEYTALADGWFAIEGVSDTMTTEIYNNSAGGIHVVSTSLDNSFRACGCIMPCKKNDTITVYYRGGIRVFRFIYAVGSEDEKP